MLWHVSGNLHSPYYIKLLFHLILTLAGDPSPSVGMQFPETFAACHLRGHPRKQGFPPPQEDIANLVTYAVGWNMVLSMAGYKLCQHHGPRFDAEVCSLRREGRGTCSRRTSLIENLSQRPSCLRVNKTSFQHLRVLLTCLCSTKKSHSLRRSGESKLDRPPESAWSLTWLVFPALVCMEAVEDQPRSVTQKCMAVTRHNHGT